MVPHEALTKIKEKLQSKNSYSDIYTLEYLTVPEEYRKSKIGYSLGDMICRLAVDTIKRSTFGNGVIAVCRTQNKVDRIFKKMNCTEFTEEVFVRKFNVKIGYIPIENLQWMDQEQDQILYQSLINSIEQFYINKKTA
jgi:hypothetical protein